ncbi:hypothetical protein PoHVEF18_010198 [Penicillium ochrochloron]
MGSRTQLPWAIDTSLTRGTPLYENKGGASGRSEFSDGSVNSEKGTSVANTQVQEKRTIIEDVPVQQTPVPGGKEWDEDNTHIHDLQKLRFEPRVPTLETSYEPMTSAVNLDFLDLDVSLDGEGILCYESPINSYDNLGSLPIGIVDEKEFRAGGLAQMGIDGGLNAAFPSESLDPVLFDSLFHDSSGGGYFNV